MTRNPFSHIDQRVGDLDSGVRFYGALLPEIGFPRDLGGRAFRVWTTPADEGPAQPWFGITEERDHVANSSRIAFWVESRDEVKRIAELVRQAGALHVSGPKEMPSYSPSYYALFFEDPWGNPLEVLHWTD